MKLLVFGASGMLGRYVCRYFESLGVELIPLSRKEFDILHLYETGSLSQTLTEVLLRVGPDYIINCAGVTNKRSECGLREMYTVNACFPLLLSKLCVKRNIGLIHPSTDCVFSGQKGDYTVSDFPDAEDDYGVSKSCGEQLHQTATSRIAVIRTSIIGRDSVNERSLVDWVFQNREKTVFGFIDHLWNGITCLEYARVMATCMEQGWNGLFHIASETTHTKEQLVRLISDAYGLETTVVPAQSRRAINRTLVPTYRVKPLWPQLKEMRYFDNNVIRVPSEYKIKGKRIVILTSAILAKSVFSPEERLSQTLESIRSVRKFIPDATVVLIEATPISDEWTMRLAERTDWFIYYGLDPSIQGLNTVLNVGLAELRLLREVVPHLQSPEQVFKLSGRYSVSELSPIEEMVNGKYNFYYDDVNKSYHTTFYSFPVEGFVELTEQCSREMEGDLSLAVEAAFLKFISPERVNRVSRLGCSGYVSGRYNNSTVFYSV